MEIKSEFIKNAFTLTIGTSIAQLFPILFYPVLGRIFTPAEFGLLATLTSITSILVVLSTGKYEGSILITDTKNDAANMVTFVVLMSFAILSTLFISLTLFSRAIGLWFNDNNLEKWLFICPLSAFVIVIYNCYNEWCVRNEYFQSLSLNKVINASSTVLSKLFLGIVKITGNGLVVGDLIGRTFSAGCCIFRALKNDKEYFIHISIIKMSELAKRYVEFPKLLLPGQLIDTINSQLATLMIAYFFFSREVGYYGMAVNLISVPSSIIAVALMDVFRQRANEEWVKKGNCRIIYVKIVKTMFVVTVPASILLMIFLPDLFSLILGEQWYIAGIYARILMPNVAILFMFQVVAAVFIIANKLKASLIWQVYSISLTLIFFLFGALVLKDMKSTLICYVIARSIANLTRFYLTYQYSKGDAN